MLKSGYRMEKPENCAQPLFVLFLLLLFLLLLLLFFATLLFLSVDLKLFFIFLEYLLMHNVISQHKYILFKSSEVLSF